MLCIRNPQGRDWSQLKLEGRFAKGSNQSNTVRDTRKEKTWKLNRVIEKLASQKSPNYPNFSRGIYLALKL